VPRTPLARSALEQVTDQVPFGIGQVGAVEGNAFTPVRRRVAVAFGAFIGSWGHPSLRLEPDDSLSSQGAPDRRCAHPQAATPIQLIGNFLQARLRVLCHDFMQSCDMLRLQCRRSAARICWRLRLGSLFRNHDMHSIAGIACHRYVCDFIYTL
jgi:hypothetical protein